MKVLVIDDERAIRGIIISVIAPGEHEILEAESAKQGLEIAIEENPDLVFCDLNCPEERDGLETIREILIRFPKTDIIAMSDNHDLLDEALKAGAKKFLQKPFPPITLLINIMREVNSKVVH